MGQRCCASSTWWRDCERREAGQRFPGGSRSRRRGQSRSSSYRSAPPSRHVLREHSGCDTNPPAARRWLPCGTKMTPSSRTCTVLCAVASISQRDEKRYGRLAFQHARTSWSRMPCCGGLDTWNWTVIPGLCCCEAKLDKGPWRLIHATHCLRK